MDGENGGDGTFPVVPAKAGTQRLAYGRHRVPDFAGTTTYRTNRDIAHFLMNYN